MPGPIGITRLAEFAACLRRRVLMPCASVALVVALTIATVAAPPPVAKMAAPGEGPEAKRAAAEREFKRLGDEAGKLVAAGKIAEAIATGEKSLTLARQIGGEGSEVVAGLEDWLAPLYVRQVDWARARTARGQTLAIRSKLYGGKDWRTTNARLLTEDVETLARLSAQQRQELLRAEETNGQLGALYAKREFSRAIRMVEGELEVHRRILGKRHPNTAADLANLAWLYQGKGEPEKAEPLYREAIGRRNDLFGANHPETAALLYDLGSLDQSKKDYAQAEPLYQQALGIQRKTLGDNHESTITTLSALAYLDLLRADYAKAVPLYREALERQTKLHGPNHPGTAGLAYNLAWIYQAQRDFAKAIPLYRQWLETQRSLGKTDASFAAGLDHLGTLYYSIGDAAKAEPFFQEALEIRRRLLGPKHPELVTTLNNLALCYLWTRDFAKGEPLCREALAIARQSRGGSEPATALCLYNLGLVEQSKGASANAESLFRQAAEIWKKGAGPARSNYGAALFALAELARFNKKPAKAEPLYRESLEVWTKAQGEACPNCASCLVGLAELARAKEDWANAALSFQKASEIWRKTNGEASGSYLRSLENLAQVEQSKGDFAQAEACYRQVMEIRRKHLGENHPETVASIVNLALLLIWTRDFGRAESLLRQVVEIRKKTLGEKHPDTATGLYMLAFLYEFKPDRGQAEALHRKALEIRRKVLGESNPDTVKSESSLVRIYIGGQEYGKAEPIARRVLEFQRKALGDKNPDLAWQLNLVASIESSLGQYAKAESLYREALEIQKKALGEANPSCAMTLDSLALMYVSMGEYAKAEPLYQQSLEIKTKALGENHPMTASTVSNLASLYTAIGDFKKSQALMRQAAAIRSATGRGRPLGKPGLQVFDYIDRNMPNYQQADPVYRQAPEMRRKVVGANRTQTVMNIDDLASLYESMQEFAKAEPLRQQSLAIRRKILGPEHHDTVSSLNNLAGLYCLMQDFAKAEPLYRQALEIRKKTLGENDLETARSAFNVGMLYSRKEEYAKAEPYYREALEIHRHLLGDENPYTADSFDSLASLERWRGQYAKAEALYQQALVIHKKSLGENSPQTMQDLNNLALLYEEMRQNAKAEQLLRPVLESAQRRLVETFGILSEHEQLELASRSRSKLDSYLSVTASAPDSAVAGSRAVPDADVYRYVLLTKGIVTAQQAFIHAALRTEKLAPLFQELQQVSRRVTNVQLSPPNQPGKMEAWRKELARLEKERSNAQQKLAARSGEFRRLEQSLQADSAAVKKLQQQLPAGAALVDILEYEHSSPPKGAQEVDDETRLVAFVVRRDAPVKRVNLGAAEPLAEAVARWRRAVSGGGGSFELAAGSVGQGTKDQPKAPQEILRERLIVPLLPHLQGIDLILLSPDGVLNQLPFAALPGSRKGRYWLEEVKLAIVPVPRELPTILKSARAADSSAHPSLLLMGDVDFGASPGLVSVAARDRGLDRAERRGAVRGPGGDPFKALPGTAEEVSGIKETYRHRFGSGDLTLLSQSRATTEAFRIEAPRHRWLHLATHGFFAPESIPSALDSRDADRRHVGGDSSANPDAVQGCDPALLSGIVFAGANRRWQPRSPLAAGSGQEMDEGILTALEVGELDLRNVELAVLSACETGLGRVAGGEGVLGLQRAFQTAGVKTCVTSLWKVDDAATQVLMTEFYTNLWQKKLGKLEALRQAQLRMLREYDPQQRTFASRGLDIPRDQVTGPKRGSPFYWAAFVLSGDWR